MDSRRVTKAADFAFALLEGVGNNPSKLHLPAQTVVVIYSAQPVIENGGLEYFYERDWPHNPPYSLFASAYGRIGAIEAAECIEKTSLMFPFKAAHRHRPRRERFIEREAPPEFRTLSARICGDRSVRDKLARYVENHRSAFGLY
jgi:hypothetical protein